MVTEALGLSLSLLVFAVIAPVWIGWLLLAFAVSPAYPVPDDAGTPRRTRSRYATACRC